MRTAPKVELFGDTPNGSANWAPKLECESCISTPNAEASAAEPLPTQSPSSFSADFLSFVLPIIEKNRYIYNVSVEIPLLPKKGATVVVGMSGGVDSTLVALLLKENGCRVIGATMSSWNNDLPLAPNPAGVRNSCYGPDEAIDIEACKTFCRAHDIEHIVVDVAKSYRAHVLDYFKGEYRSGRTPNPCVFCNPNVKFGSFLDGIRAHSIEFDFFCTGHYARLVRASENLVPGWDMCVCDESGESGGENESNESGKRRAPLLIANAIDDTKDQTYFLNRIPSAVLEKVCFPLGTLTKKRVYELARERNLVAAKKKESQDFIPSEYLGVLFADSPSVAGDIVDLHGNVLGRHKGIEFYTIGQRRGLGVSAKNPLYVHSIDAENNRVVLSENEALTRTGLIATDWVWPNNRAPDKPFTADVKIRLASTAVRAVISPLESRAGAGVALKAGAASDTRGTGSRCGAYRVEFEKPVRAVAPGQSAVAYINGMIVGGGIISQENDE